jgi:hypothetical protein
MTKTIQEKILCFIRDGRAYFTPLSLEEQTGDDWNDRPYQCNAGIPYGDDIEIVCFDSCRSEPHYNDGLFSVEDINLQKKRPWLYAQNKIIPPIFAGMTKRNFIKSILVETHGRIWLEVKNYDL